MNPTECKFCGFTEKFSEICAVCGAQNETQIPPSETEIKPPVQQTVLNFPPSNYQNTNQRPPVRVSVWAACGAEVPAFRRLCGGCEQPEKKSGFNFLRLAIILVPLLMVLILTVGLFYFYFEDPAHKTVREFEKVTGLTKDFNYDNYKITGTSNVKIRQSVPNERGYYPSPETDLAFEMVFSKNNQFYVHFYRDPKESVDLSQKKTVYQAGSNGYRHWQSVLAWSNLGTTSGYSHRVTDSEGFPNIIHKNILLGLTEIKSFEKIVPPECAGIPLDTARFIMPSKTYTVDERKYTAYPCELTYLSVQDNKGYSSVLGFDTQTGVVLTERGKAIIEDKNASIEMHYGAYKKFSVGQNSRGSTEKRIILVPTFIFMTITIGNTPAAAVKLNIKTLETNTAVDPTEFEMPIL